MTETSATYGIRNDAVVMDDRTRRLLMGIRQAVIILLGHLEDYLQLPRSIVPKRKR